MKKFGLSIIAFLLIITTFGQENQKPHAKNIILLIGDGMGVTQVYAAMTANKAPLNLEEFKNIGFSKTYSADSYTTDSGAAGTAIATGYKTYNAAIGMDIDTIPRKTILEYAELNGKLTGLVATSQVIHATPASFVSHQTDRYKYEEIAFDIVQSNIDVFIGGGLNYFNKRKDNIDLTQNLISKGYEVVYNLKELQNSESRKLAGLLYKDKPPRFSKGRKDMLPKSSSKAVEILSAGEEGFFLMIEGSQIDWGGHDNNTEYVVEEMLDFDKTIGVILEFAKKDKNTLIIVTADHETGGMGVNAGNMETGKVEAQYTTSHHTGVMVPVFAFGPGSENFRGIYENTDLFDKMMEVFGFVPEL